MLPAENITELKIRTRPTDPIQAEYLLQTTEVQTEITAKTELPETEATLQIDQLL